MTTDIPIPNAPEFDQYVLEVEIPQDVLPAGSIIESYGVIYSRDEFKPHLRVTYQEPNQ